jgi:hypothetical protein
MVNCGMGDRNVIETILETMRRVEATHAAVELSVRRS